MAIGSNNMLTINNSGANKNAAVKLFNLSGRLVKSVVMDKQSKTVSLKKLNRGLFVVQFKADGVSESEKLILK